MATSNGHWLTQRLRSWGNQPALIWHGETWSFTRLCDSCDDWLGQLAQHGVGPGDTLAICGDYSPNACALLLAALRNRNIIVPLASAIAFVVSESRTIAVRGLVVFVAAARSRVVRLPMAAIARIIVERIDWRAGLRALASCSAFELLHIDFADAH